MSTFWSFWIISLTVICNGLILWVLLANRKVALKDDHDPENKTTGHNYDGIEEYDNPLPKWWFQLFVGSIIYSVLYVIWYPGLGGWAGIGGWTSEGELARDQQKAQAKFAETYDVYMKLPVEELVYNPQALEMGVRIFSNNCAVCHGSDGGGNVGIPNLADKDWLYGGSPEQIRHSIEHGRAGNMPPWGDILGSDNINMISEYVLKLSGQKHDVTLAKNGEGLFAQNCSACHGEAGTGMYVLGAPNLTDDTWLHGGEKSDILRAVWYGFNTSNMPAHKELLREHKLHLLTAYVYSLSYDYE